MPLVLCSHNAAVLHMAYSNSLFQCTTRNWNVLPIELIRQHFTLFTPSRVTWTLNHRLSIVFNLAGNVACLAALRLSSVSGCTFVEQEEQQLHARFLDRHWIYRVKRERVKRKGRERKSGKKKGETGRQENGRRKCCSFQVQSHPLSPTPSSDWNYCQCQWGQSGGRGAAYTRAVSEHRCFPQKETKYSYNAFQMTSQKSI